MNNYDINKTLLQKYWCLSMQKLKILELNSGKVFKTITKPKYTTRK